MVFCSGVKLTPGAVWMLVASILSSPVEAILSERENGLVVVYDVRSNGVVVAARIDGAMQDLISKCCDTRKEVVYLACSRKICSR